MRDRLRALLDRIVPTGSVFDRTIKSGIWVGGIKAASRLMQILMLIVLARLLAPRDFGLMGLALLSVSATRNFTKVGLNAALIQRKTEDVDDYLDTTWCLEAARGLLIAGILFLLAPVIASFFSEPRATPLIRVIGLGPLLVGLRNPGIVYFKKDLEFHKEFLYQVSGGFVQFFVGVGYALYSPTVWALVFAFVAADAFRSLLSYVIHDYRPWPSFDVGAAKELIDYGKWITASSMVYFIYSEGDDAFVGWFLSATSLGFYQYAYRLADTPSSEVSEIIASVSFPAYAKLQDDPDEMRRALLATTRVTAFLTIPMAFGIAAVAPSFVPVVLGSDWTPMIAAMQLLALFGMFHSITRNFGSVFKAIDRPDLNAKLGAVRVVCIAALIWPLTARFGIEGTALTVVLVYVFPMIPLDVYVISRVTAVRARAFYREWAYPLIAAGTMFGLLRYAQRLTDLSPVVELALTVPAGAAIYLAVSYVLDRQLGWGIQRNLRSMLGALG
ncbi:lipopolysaccharide biosynthesis protein [Halorubrum lipolyticum]|uniref:Export protein n=1 Tax=Halorubrum lipolyticum DSM 21995 TaxID=1227482 RepID=M0P2D7_9EURY|nr:lipopolysaccharide biosynthesis protein [Halorubrum lipolyticum]EMA63694.1 export protein [Halorubrum lipolyticum DSM 21995]